MPPSDPDVGASRWWRDGVLYQIYPRSFADSTGSGHGDLRGVIEHLDHLSWLGIDGIWLSPINPSPDADWGYDVADYTDVDPDFGTLEDLDRLVAEAADRGIRVLIDLVPNHTSDRHPWFVDARSSRSAEHRDWYVWADGGPDGSPPNNWRSSFGGPAWTWDDATGQFYLHNFLPQQPDLNWWNPQVARCLRRHRAVLVRPGRRRVPDRRRARAREGPRRSGTTPPALETDHPSIRRHGLRSDFSMNRPEAHDVLRRWRTIADAVPSASSSARRGCSTWRRSARFYGNGEDELHLALNVPFVFSTPGEEMREIVERTQAVLPAGRVAPVERVEPRRRPVRQPMVRRR